MSYTVIWLTGAEQELATLWLEPSARAEVTRAANEIDELLRRDPTQLGESCDRGQRIYFQTPLGVLFRVKEDDRLVEVIHVWKFT